MPVALTVSREWWRDGGWPGWPEVFGQFVQPVQQDLAKSPHVQPELLVDAPPPLEQLPPAPTTASPPPRSVGFVSLVVVVATVNDTNPHRPVAVGGTGSRRSRTWEFYGKDSCSGGADLGSQWNGVRPGRR